MATSRTISRALGGIALIGLIALGACSPSVEGYAPAPTASKLPVAQWTVSRLDLRFVPGKSALAPGEEQRLLGALALENPDRPLRLVARTAPAGTPGKLAVERAEALRKLIETRGFKLEFQGPGGAIEDPEVADMAAFYVGRYEVTVPGCPDWRKPGIADFSNKESTNFGCANAMNLALMLADPGDLSRGDSSNVADGARAAMAVKQYQLGGMPRVASPDLPNAKSAASLTSE